jgi:teichuronic acid biosynthesis glycosyltransferase TuaG
MNKNYLISIITPSYNSSKFIPDTLNSVLAQTYQNWEMIIVDDVSNDNSIEVIEEYLKKDSRIKLVQLKNNSGAAVARNTAINAAEGRFIAFLDSDDLWMPTKLEKQLNFMIKNNYDFTYTHYDLIDEENIKYGKTFKAQKEVSYHDLLKTCSIGCLTVIYDTKKIGKVYMPLIRRRQDYGLWLKILKTTPKAYCLEESLAVYRRRQNSISSNKKKAALFQWKIYREVEKLNIFSSLFYFIHYAINGFKKYK